MDNFHLQEEKYRIQVHNKKKGTYNPTSDMKTCGYISFDMLGSNFGPDCKYLR